MAKAFDLAVTPWSPLGGGILTGKYNQGNGSAQGRMQTTGADISEQKLAIANVVSQVGAEIGRTPSQVALAWLRIQDSTIIPIIGSRKVSQVKDNLACLEVTLAPEHLARLNEVSRIEIGFPHDFLSSDMIRDRLFGGTFDLIDH